MNTLARYCFLSILPISAVLAQTAETSGRFEVSDVHPSPKGAKETGLYVHAGRIEVHGATVLHLIMAAYGVHEDRIFGGPNWLDTDRFEIVAKTSSPLNHETLGPLLQSLLADRFRLEIRHEDKPEPIYALLAVRKVQLKERPEPGEPKCSRTNSGGYLTAECTSITMAGLAERLPSIAGNYFDHPVVDKTGLTAAYDFTLKWTGRGQLGVGDADHPSISLFDYLEKQLGIKAEAQTRPAPSLVIAHVEAPTPNEPGVAAKLPPPVTEFEVAEVRPSKPDSTTDVSIHNGRIEAIGLTLRQLIAAAYDLDDDENTVLGGEKWIGTDKFDIIAKAPPTTTDATLRAMLLTLLEQRFHLKVHHDLQPQSVYALTAPKGAGKLKRSTSEEHAGCVRTPKDAAFTYTCHNTTMAQLVDKLPDVPGAVGYFNLHVIDLTNLKDGFDFEITWSPPARFQGRSMLQSSAGAPAAQAPVSGFTIFEAIEKQLGLKLAEQKYPLPVVVIDHVDRTPAEN
jgi:uncharacterized protein (TIGR03435 family)